MYQTNGEIIEILHLTIHKTQYCVQAGPTVRFYEENDEISKNAIAFTADKPKIWGKKWKFPKLHHR